MVLHPPVQSSFVTFSLNVCLEVRIIHQIIPTDHHIIQATQKIVYWLITIRDEIIAGCFIYITTDERTIDSFEYIKSLVLQIWKTYLLGVMKRNPKYQATDDYTVKLIIGDTIIHQKQNLRRQLYRHGHCFQYHSTRWSCIFRLSSSSNETKH